MYEFVAKVDEDILRTMSVNWKQMCKSVLPSIDGEMTLGDEKQALTRVTKNTYHRKPSVLPITFTQVSSFLTGKLNGRIFFREGCVAFFTESNYVSMGFVIVCVGGGGLRSFTQTR